MMIDEMPFARYESNLSAKLLSAALIVTALSITLSIKSYRAVIISSSIFSADLPLAFKAFTLSMCACKSSLG